MKGLFEYIAFRTVAAALQCLPLRAVRILAKALTAFVFYGLPVRKELTLRQIRGAFPDAGEREIRRWAKDSYTNLVTSIFELMWTPRLTRSTLEREVRMKNAQLLTDVHHRGKGMLLMSGHFGNWEWLSIGCAALAGLQFHVIVHPMQNPRVDRLVEGYRERLGNKTVPMGIAVRDILTTLQNNGVVAMLADQSAAKEALFVDFMGKPAATYEGPALFALRTGAPIVIGFSVRQPGGEYSVILEEVETADLHGATEANIRELTLRHVRVLERFIREHPGHWLWQHKRWKHKPQEQAQ